MFLYLFYAHILCVCVYAFVGRWLVEKFPQEALVPYASETNKLYAGEQVKKEYMPYSGENVLHMYVSKFDLFKGRKSCFR